MLGRIIVKRYVTSSGAKARGARDAGIRSGRLTFPLPHATGTVRGSAQGSESSNSTSLSPIIFQP